MKDYPEKDIDFPCKKAIARTADKVRMKEVLIDAGIKTPGMVLRPEDFDLPLIFKRYKHSRGRGMKVIHTMEGVRYRAGKGYFERIHKAEREFRVHVCDGVRFHTDEKFLKDGEEGHHTFKNSRYGYVYLRPKIRVPENITDESIKAVEALGLDFGAVDIGWNEDGAWVYEVNTAVGMRTKTRKRYTEMLTELIENKIDELWK